ncbi:MAG TPA: VWA domain-containing protein [Thermoanaerobaculia bacterium]|jgi:VWFA-related protein
MKALAVAVTFALSLSIVAQAATGAGNDVQRKLSRRERNARIAALPAAQQDFVNDAGPILLPAELDAFLSLQSESERQSFIDDFWRRRDAMQPGRHTRVFRDVYYERLEQAKQAFKKLDSDRSRLFLLHGPPLQVVRGQCSSLLQPMEIWKYPELPGLGTNVRLLFYKPRNFSDFKLWNPIGGSLAMADLVAGDSAAFGADPNAARKAFNESSSPYAYISKIQLECRDSGEILAAITGMVQARIDLLHLFEPPQPESEEGRKMLRNAVVANPNAPKLNAEFSVRYPAKEGSRTDVQMMVQVPRAELTPADVVGVEVYTIDVVGEVLRDGQFFEKYRYRFDFPGDAPGEKLPIVIDRLLRPNDYTSRIKVVDANGGAEALIENDISVPEIFTPEAVQEPAVQAATATPAAAPAKSEAKAVETSLRIIPPTDEIVSGVQSIETIITGDAIKAVEFSMDGKKLAVRRQPPYALDFDFGVVPQTRRIRAVALDANNKPIAGDDLVVNSGTDPFRVRITSPRVAPSVSGPVRVEMDVSVPDGEELAALELFWNERRLAALYDPPFVQTVDIPSTAGVGYLRAVATLKSGSAAPVEDVVMVNTPAYMEELNVHLVELPTTVLVSGKPSSTLTEQSFKVLDDGKPVTLAKFEYVKNLPLSIGLAVDTSGSMKPRMDEAQKAGAQFLQNILKKGDKAFLVSFDKEPRMVQRWSPKLADMHAGLAKLRAEETTALYDAVVYALYNFLGVKGQKALVLISDGKDTASKFTFDQAVEYARRTAVPIYGVGIGIKGNEMDVRYKLSRLASETGGAVYYIEQARDLERVYSEIESELRSQYILGFYPSADAKPGKWRELTVQTTEGKARTIRGYYP